jgi:CRP/FNR family transcriptional regulator, cyclic AMP receptor protein
MTAVGPILMRHHWERPADADLVGTVAQVPLFAKLGRRQVRKLARDVELAGFVPGDVVLPDSAAVDFFYVVLRGEAELRQDERARRLRPGEYFGETALLDGRNRSVTVVATDELQVLRLPGSVFLRLLRRDPAIAFAVLKHVGDRVRGRDPRLIARAA